MKTIFTKTGRTGARVEVRAAANLKGVAAEDLGCTLYVNGEFIPGPTYPDFVPPARRGEGCEEVAYVLGSRPQLGLTVAEYRQLVAALAAAKQAMHDPTGQKAQRAALELNLRLLENAEGAALDEAFSSENDTTDERRSLRSQLAAARAALVAFDAAHPGAAETGTGFQPNADDCEG